MLYNLSLFRSIMHYAFKCNMPFVFFRHIVNRGHVMFKKGGYINARSLNCAPLGLHVTCVRELFMIRPSSFLHVTLNITAMAPVTDYLINRWGWALRDALSEYMMCVCVCFMHASSPGLHGLHIAGYIAGHCSMGVMQAF